MKAPLTAERLREALQYDPTSGVFTSRRSGRIVGTAHCAGYRTVSVDGRKHLAHRAAWLYVYGKWPDNDIDHIDRNKTNNSIANLRDVPRRINQQNVVDPKASNKSSGLLGASLCLTENWPLAGSNPSRWRKDALGAL